MKVTLRQLLPANLSNETAFHLVKFVHGLSLALETIYFDEMLQHTSQTEENSFSMTGADDSDVPF